MRLTIRRHPSGVRTRAAEASSARASVRARWSTGRRPPFGRPLRSDRQAARLLGRAGEEPGGRIHAACATFRMALLRSPRRSWHRRAGRGGRRRCTSRQAPQPTSTRARIDSSGRGTRSLSASSFVERWLSCHRPRRRRTGGAVGRLVWWRPCQHLRGQCLPIWLRLICRRSPSSPSFWLFVVCMLLLLVALWLAGTRCSRLNAPADSESVATPRRSADSKVMLEDSMAIRYRCRRRWPSLP